MTENEAKVILESEYKFHGDCSVFGEALTVAIQALEEIQQYRELEEKLNGITVEQVVRGFIDTLKNGTAEGYEKGRILTNAEADMWDKYKEIGTVEELQALKEKNSCKDCAGCTVWKCDCSNIRAETIDEFVNKLKEDYVFDSISRDDISKYEYQRVIDRIAEQMKGSEADEIDRC